MKLLTRKRLLIVAVAVASLLFVVPNSHAEVIITQRQTKAIRTHCVENQASLNQLHQSDAFLRIDRGNLYRTISDKLMTPLNTRLAANKLDGGALISITKEFNDQYKRFYANYITYDTALAKLLNVDCTKEPVRFYNALLDTREARQQLGESNDALVQLIRDYKNQFDDFYVAYMESQ